MGHLPKLSDRDLDRLMAGHAPPDESGLTELAEFVGDLRASLEERIGDEIAGRHVAAMIAEARLLADGEQPTSALGLPPPKGFRRRQMFYVSRSSGRAKLATATAAVLVVAFGGAASAGMLPGPVQDSVSSIAGNLGVSLPGDEVGEPQDTTPRDDVEQGPQGNVDDGPQGNIDDGPQGNVDDGPQGNLDDGPQGDVDDGPQGNVDDGPQGNVDDGPQGNVDDGPQGNVDDGPQGNLDDGSQGNVDEGTQGDGDDSAPASPGTPAPPAADGARGGGDQGTQGGD